MEHKDVNITDELIALYLEGRLDGAEKAAVEAFLSEDEDAMDTLFLARAELAYQEAQPKTSVFAKSLSGYGTYALAAASEKMDCAIKAQQMVLRSYGIEAGVDELTELALKQGWFEEGKGSAFDFVGELLNHYGVEAVQMRNAGVYHLMHELSQGHKIIVGVDDGQQTTPEDHAKHVMLVAGIDTSDPDQLKVVARDPSNPDKEEVYTAADFVERWRHTGCFMVATKQPAPLSANPEMEHFDYQLGYVRRFADVAYEEIVKRLAADGIIVDAGKERKKKRRFYWIGALALLAVGAAAFAYWRVTTPVHVKVNLLEDPSRTIPALPFTKGLIRCEYAGNALQEIPVTAEDRTVYLNDIPYRDRKTPLHLVFAADGYCTVDTVLPVSETVTLPLRRNNDLGLLFGVVVDLADSAPVEGAVVRLQDLECVTDAFGQFRIEIPFSKQDKAQHVSVMKEGYQLWDGIYRPSATDPWYIELTLSN